MEKGNRPQRETMTAGHPNPEAKARLARNVRGASVLAIGSLGSQVALILVLPIVTWLFTPEDFGVFGSFSSFVAIFGFAGCLAYQAVFFLTDDAGEEQALVRLCTVSALIMALLAGITSWIWMSLIPPEYAFSAIFFAIALVLGVFPRALMVALQAAAVKHEQYGLATSAQLVRTLAIILVWLSPLVLFEDVPGWLLIAGFAGGSWFGLAVLAAAWTEARGSRPVDDGFQVPTVRRLAREHWRYPVFEAPAVMLRQVSINGPILLFASLYGALAAGLVALALQAISRPATLVTQVVGDILRREYGEHLRHGRHADAFKFLLLSKIGFAVAGVLAGLIIWFLAEPVVETFLPQEWQGSAEAFKAIAPSLAATILIRPSILLASLNQRQRDILLFECISIAMMVATIFGGWYAGLMFAQTLLVYSVAFALLGVAFVLLMTIVQRRSFDASRSQDEAATDA